MTLCCMSWALYRCYLFSFVSYSSMLCRLWKCGGMNKNEEFGVPKFWLFWKWVKVEQVRNNVSYNAMQHRRQNSGTKICSSVMELGSEMTASVILVCSAALISGQKNIYKCKYKCIIDGGGKNSLLCFSSAVSLNSCTVHHPQCLWLLQSFSVSGGINRPRPLPPETSPQALTRITVCCNAWARKKKLREIPRSSPDSLHKETQTRLLSPSSNYWLCVFSSYT